MAREHRQSGVSRAVSEAMAASEAGRALAQHGAATRAEQTALRLEPTPSDGDGKPQSDGAKPLQRRNEPRERAMDEILSHREKEGVAPVPAAAPEPEQTEKAPKAAEPKAEDAAPQQTEPVQGAAPAVEPAAPAEAVEMVTVKVDGVESQASKADVDAAGGLHAYQRDKASENRLAKAQQAVAEAKAMQAQIAAFLQHQQAVAAQQVPQVTEDQFIAQKLDAIRFGSNEEGAAAMREVLSRQAVDPNAVVVQATTSMKYEMAKAKFTADYNDLHANPVLSKLVRTIEQEEVSKFVQGGRVNWGALANVDWNGFFNTIGVQVRGALGRSSQPASTLQAVASPAQAGAAAQGNLSQPADKEARKAAVSSVVSLPTASARAAAPEAEKPETREDILNSMRKKRGIPTG